MRFDRLKTFLSRTSSLAHPDFEPTPQIVDILQEQCRILVIGAGGLGCEILKNLALLGFGEIDVIDMDTIDLSNLNRQFLFRQRDVGKPKAQIAAEFIMNRIPTCKVNYHFNRIEDKDDNFYRQFHLIVTGLDSVVARRWINNMIYSLLTYDSDGNITGGIIPMVDGGTEGFKGNSRIICPTQTACLECNLDLYPPQVNYPLCTIASVPRQPEHCIEYARLMAWSDESPFGDNPVDGDNPDHIIWLMNRAIERANEFNIPSGSIDFRKTQGVVKRIIPAVASTNAVIAAQCSTEAFKLVTSAYKNMEDYTLFNQTEGVYSYTFQCEKKDDCLICGKHRKVVTVSSNDKLSELITMLKEGSFQMSAPTLTTTINGKQKTLYLEKITKTHDNLNKKLAELDLQDNQEISVSDRNYVAPVTLQLKFTKD